MRRQMIAALRQRKAGDGKMKKYLAFFRLRFAMGLQYRVAAWAGMMTQFFWGAMEIMMFRAFYQENPQQFPMTFQAAANYVWFQQAFLALFAAWRTENEVFESISNGNIAYEMCRPIRIYPMLFARVIAVRVSSAALRCMPILIVAAFLPKPYGLSLPESEAAFGLFGVTLILGFLVVAAFSTLIYVIAFFTISPQGLKITVSSAMEFFTGAVIPLPFLPEKAAAIIELLPFASMQNVPLRIYSGDIAGAAAGKAVCLQVFWLAVLVAAGQLLMRAAERRIVLQGG